VAIDDDTWFLKVKVVWHTTAAAAAVSASDNLLL
jgi:hypothetical protein